LGLDVVDESEGLIGRLGPAVSVKFLVEAFDGAVGGQAFVVQVVLDASHDGDVVHRVPASARSIAFGFQLWKTAFPLTKDVRLDPREFADFRYGIAPIFLRHHCIFYVPGFSNLLESTVYRLQSSAIQGLQRLQTLDLWTVDCGL